MEARSTDCSLSHTLRAPHGNLRGRHGPNDLLAERGHSRVKANNQKLCPRQHSSTAIKVSTPGPAASQSHAKPPLQICSWLKLASFSARSHLRQRLLGHHCHLAMQDRNASRAAAAVSTARKASSMEVRVKSVRFMETCIGSSLQVQIPLTAGRPPDSGPPWRSPAGPQITTGQVHVEGDQRPPRTHGRRTCSQAGRPKVRPPVGIPHTISVAQTILAAIAAGAGPAAPVAAPPLHTSRRESQVPPRCGDQCRARPTHSSMLSPSRGKLRGTTSVAPIRGADRGAHPCQSSAAWLTARKAALPPPPGGGPAMLPRRGYGWRPFPRPIAAPATALICATIPSTTPARPALAEVGHTRPAVRRILDWPLSFLTHQPFRPTRRPGLGRNPDPRRLLPFFTTNLTGFVPEAIGQVAVVRQVKHDEVRLGTLLQVAPPGLPGAHGASRVSRGGDDGLLGRGQPQVAAAREMMNDMDSHRQQVPGFRSVPRATGRPMEIHRARIGVVGLAIQTSFPAAVSRLRCLRRPSAPCPRLACRPGGQPTRRPIPWRDLPLPEEKIRPRDFRPNPSTWGCRQQLARLFGNENAPSCRTRQRNEGAGATRRRKPPAASCR